MNFFKTKFKSNTGASMLIAIVFMLFAIFVGGSIYAAASVNLGRIRDTATADQALLSQSSAARMIVGDLQKNSVDPDNPGYLLPIKFDSGSITSNGSPAISGTTSELRKLACLCAAYAYVNGDESAADAYWNQPNSFGENGIYKESNAVTGTDSYSTAFSLRVQTTSDNSIDETLDCTLTCDKNFNVTVTFDDGVVYVRMRCASMSDGTLVWSEPEIVKGGNAA